MRGHKEAECPPCQQKQNKKKMKKNQEKGGKSGRKGKNREGSFTLPLLTNRAGYTTVEKQIQRLSLFHCLKKASKTRGDTLTLQHMGMCRPNGLLFHQKSLDMGPILIKRILRRGSIS